MDGVDDITGQAWHIYWHTYGDEKESDTPSFHKQTPSIVIIYVRSTPTYLYLFYHS